jgi:hypothetical protein
VNPPDSPAKPEEEDDDEEEPDEADERLADDAPPNARNHLSTDGPSPNAAIQGNHASFIRGAGRESSRSKYRRAATSSLRRAIFRGPLRVFAALKRLFTTAS